MAEGTKSAADFNDELLSTNSFSCKTCENFLEPPVMLIEGIGNICKTCFLDDLKKYDDCKILPNEALDAIIEKMYYRCPFQDAGCRKRLALKELQAHKSICRFRTIKCAFFTHCCWNGRLDDFWSHTLQIHKDSIISNSNNKFTLITKLNEEIDKVFIISTTRKNCLFRMKTDNDKIRYKVYDPQNNSSSYTISVKHVGEADHHFKSYCQISNVVDIGALTNQDSVSIDLKILMSVIQANESFITIIKIKNQEKVKFSDESMLHYFECPVCKNFMKSLIYQCSAGHSVCHSCKPQLERCPTCRANFNNVRNYSLEALAGKLHYPCIYCDHGCTETGSQSKMIKHELSCRFRPYTCFFRGCYFNGIRSSFITHLRQVHPEKVYAGDTHHFTMSFHLDRNVSSTTLALLANNHIFKLCYKQSLDNAFWGVALDAQGTKSNECNFVYEVELADPRRPNKKLIRSDACLQRTFDEEEIFRKCITLPKVLVSPFASDNLIRFYIKIIENEY